MAMIKTKRVTTREIEVTKYDECGYCIDHYSVRPAIDDSLSMLAWRLFNKIKYSGEIETSWRNGGMREPQTPGYSNDARKEIIAKPMKEHLPAGYSGTAMWLMNSGEFSVVKLIPFN